MTQVLPQRAARSIYVLVCLLVSALAFLSGCAGGRSAPNPDPPTAISVSASPTTAAVQTGQGQNFTATVTNDSQSKGVAWALSGTGCTGSACGTLSGTSGAAITYTAPSSVPNPATVNLTATSVADGTKSAAAMITVTAPPTIVVTVSPATVNVPAGGSTQNFVATLQNDSQNKGVTWTLSGTGCTANNKLCGTLSATSSLSGVAIIYTAPAAVPDPGTVTLTATSVADDSKVNSATITVASPVSVSIAPPSVSVQVSLTQPFTATVQNDSQGKGVTWTLTGAGCAGAACGSLSANSSASGAATTYTAPSAVPSPATVILTATSVADGTKSAAATITLTTTALNVTVAPTTASVQANIGKQSFTASLQNDSQNKGVTWTLTLSGANCNSNTCGTVSPTSSGSGAAVTYTAPTAAPSGVITLTASAVTDGSKLATATITVTPAISVSNVTPPSAPVAISQTQNFTVTLQNDAPPGKGVTWSLTQSAANCAPACGALTNASTTSVTYTAPVGVPTSPTVILAATSVADGSKSAAATITVTPGNVSVALAPKRGGLPVSQSLNLTATVADDPGNHGATWTATGSNCTGSPACGSFSVATPPTSATYTAPSTAGVYTITATSVADPTQSASATIGVTDLAGVFTHHNDLSRDGVNVHEYALTASNVATATFGKLFSCIVDGPIYTQPLWIPGLTITANGTTAAHNVIIVATQNDSLYAFDADASSCTLLWYKNLINPGEAPVPAGISGNLVGRGGGDITPAVGVTGTPVIDPSTNPPTLYVVSKSYTTTGPTFFQRLHAISVTTGNEVLGGPVPISASVAGTAPDASGGRVAFNPQTQNQRAALALVGNVVYVCWGSHEDQQPFHGWIMGFNKTSLSLVTTFNATTNEPDLIHGGGGIWMAGGSPAFDGTNLFLITGNGHWDGSTDFGDSVLKLSISNTGALSVADWFTPSDQDNLANNDLDLGSGGAATLVDVPLAPVPHLLVAGGKQGSGNPGELFVLNRDNLGKFTNTDSGVVQNFATGNQIFSTPAFWNNTLYVAPATPSNGNLMSYPFNTTSGLFNTSPSSQSATSFGFPGPTPSISASSGTNGIVWVLDGTMFCTNQSPGCGPAVLHAYDATNLGNELWNSSQGSGNTAGNAVKFTVPTVANGKVYIGTRGTDTVNGGTGELDVYGLLPN